MTRLRFVGLGLVLFFLALAILAPFIAPYDPSKIGIAYQPPSSQHPLGTNDVGQDIFSELLYGTRVSMLIGIGAAVIITLVGTFLGVLAGFWGGMTDRIITALINMAMSLPSLPLAFVLAAYLPSGVLSILFSICITSWASSARLVRARTMQLAKMPFVKASMALGISKTRVVIRHILPNVSSLVFTKGALAIASAMLMESSLSFLGLGAHGQKSWGNILYFALNRNGVINGYWWWYLPPILCICLCTMGFMLLCYQSE